MHCYILEKARTLFREEDGIINAKQTRQLQPFASISSPSRTISLETPKVGFLKTNKNVQDLPTWEDQYLDDNDGYFIQSSKVFSSATKASLYYYTFVISSIPLIILLLKFNI